MKKSDKISFLHDSIGTYKICRCYLNYDPNYRYYYILDVSEKFLLGIEEDDFILDGFQIRKISDIGQLEIKDDLCKTINEENKLLDGVNKPQIDLSSWESVFESLKQLNIFIIVENDYADEDDKFFYMGFVTEIKKSYIVFSAVDAEGEWYENIEISYSEISSVTFNDRYSKTWQKYLSEHK